MCIIKPLSMRVKSRYLFVLMLTSIFAYLPICSAENQLVLTSSDNVTPIVEHELPNTPVRIGSGYTITVKVTDNNGVKDVVLHYRSMGSEVYQLLSMTLQDDENYSVTLTADSLHAPGIEYYIQATDFSNNSLLHGNSFSPLMVKIIGEDEGISTTETALFSDTMSIDKQASSSLFSNKWLWFGLGVVAIAAASAGEDGNDNSGSSSTTSDTTVTFIVDEPTRQ